MDYPFIILFGIINLFADMTYEGGRSIGGPFLALLGANGLIVGMTAGIGELVGYGIRLISGPLCDKTGKYWPAIVVGYVINLVAIPLLAISWRWEVASVLIILERLGRGIRMPPRDALISFASQKRGRGFGFGVLEGMDQFGALIGPLIVSGILYATGNYYLSFAVLAVPAAIALAILMLTRISYPVPEKMEKEEAPPAQNLPRQFWLYLVGLAIFAAGFIDFALASFHFKKVGVYGDATIPLVYALAMGLSGLMAFIFGLLYDRFGIKFFVPAFVCAAVSTPLLFFGNSYAALAGIILWAIGLGMQESIMLAYVADKTAKSRRGTAFGLFYLVFGVFWFSGSVFEGWLYDVSLIGLVIFSSLMQLAPLFIMRSLFYGKTVKPQ